MMAKIILDMCGDVVVRKDGKKDIKFDDGVLLSECTNLCAVAFNILNESGPGGGWPEVVIFGDKIDIVRYLSEHYCTDLDDVEFHTENIEN